MTLETSLRLHKHHRLRLTRRAFLTTEELARRWEVPTSWIYSNRERLGIPALRVGAHYRYPLDQIEGWEHENTINAIGGI